MNISYNRAFRVGRINTCLVFLFVLALPGCAGQQQRGHADSESAQSTSEIRKPAKRTRHFGHAHGPRRATCGQLGQ